MSGGRVDVAGYSSHEYRLPRSLTLEPAIRLTGLPVELRTADGE